MNKLEALWYRLTAWYPRKLPRSALEYCRMKDILCQAFDLKNEPAVWMTVAGTIHSTFGTSVRRPLSHIVNMARRLEINKLAHFEKMIANANLEKQLQEAMKNAGAELAEKAPETPPIEVQASVQATDSP